LPFLETVSFWLIIHLALLPLHEFLTTYVYRIKPTHSLGLDEFGVLHDEPSSQSLENVTDDDFSGKLLASG